MARAGVHSFTIAAVRHAVPENTDNTIQRPSDRLPPSDAPQANKPSLGEESRANPLGATEARSTQSRRKIQSIPPVQNARTSKSDLGDSKVLCTQPILACIHNCGSRNKGLERKGMPTAAASRISTLYLRKQPLVAFPSSCRLLPSALFLLVFVLFLGLQIPLVAEQPVEGPFWGAIGGCYGAFSSLIYRSTSSHTTPVSGGASNMDDPVEIA